MNLLFVITIVFVIMEIANVFSLYFKHETKMFNGIGVFKAWEKSKEDSEVHDLVKYLVFWVAGTKVIFLSLIVVILILGDPLIQYVSVLVLVMSISTFYFKLFPIARKMDIENQLDPKGYSRVLGIMIACMMFALFLGFLVTFLTQ